MTVLIKVRDRFQLLKSSFSCLILFHFIIQILSKQSVLLSKKYESHMHLIKNKTITTNSNYALLCTGPDNISKRLQGFSGFTQTATLKPTENLH